MDYVEVFKNLKPSTRYSRNNSKKAALLLAVIEMYENNTITNNEIRYDETLKSTFLKVWNRTFPDDASFISDAYYPFWYMQAEEFWHVVPIRGKEDILSLFRNDQVKPSESKLLDCVRYVELDEDLYFMMTMSSGRSELKRALLETYSSLSERMINRLSDSSNNNIDSSTITMRGYEEILKPSDKNSTLIDLNDIHFNQLDDEIQITFILEYYKFLKQHRQERELFREVCPSVEIVFEHITTNPISQGELSPSYAQIYDNFLCELKIALMGEDQSMDIIDDINRSLDILKGSNSEYCNSGSDDGNLSDSNSDYDSYRSEEENSISPSLEDYTTPINIADDEQKISTYYQLGYSIEFISDALGLSEISINKSLAKLGLIDDNTENNVDEQPSSTPGTPQPIDFFIENSQSEGSIYNLKGERVYTVNGQLKILNGKPYRFNLKEMCFTVKDLIREGDRWIKGKKKIVAYSGTDLFDTLESSRFINQISDIVEMNQFEDNMILVDGKWYDYKGDFMFDKDDSQISGKVPLSKAIPNNNGIELKEKFELIYRNAHNSYDLLWIMAICDSLWDKRESPSLTYDELACLMIANAWEMLNKYPRLKKQEPVIAECVKFLIEESKEYMDVTLRWFSPKEIVFNAIRDYPMAGAFEEAVEEMLSATPINVLKAWLPSEDEEEIILKSLAFENDCLYAIHPKKFDSNIELNPNLISFLELKQSEFMSFMQRKYKEYLKV